MKKTCKSFVVHITAHLTTMGTFTPKAADTTDEAPFAK